MIIGLSGMPASGKDTVAEYLQNKGFDHISLSAVLRDILRERDLEINLENLTKVGNSLGKEFGQGYLIERAREKADFSKDLIVSSIRQPGEITELRKQKDFKMIFVDADARTRFERLKLRGRSGDSETFEQFMIIENKQVDGKSGGMNLGECRRMADFVLINDGTPKDLKEKIEQILQEIKG